MNVLIVASKFPPEYSGPGVRIPRLYKAIGKELGIDNIFVFTNGTELLNDADYEYEGCSVRRRARNIFKRDTLFSRFLPERIRNLAAHFIESFQAVRFLKYYEDKKIDLVHIIGNSGGTASALQWARTKNIPVLMELVNATSLPYQRFFLSRIKPEGDYLIVAISLALKDKCIRLGIPAQNVWARPNPIGEEFFPEPEKKMEYRRRTSDFGADDIVLLSIAKFIPRKNQIFLLEVLKDLPENYKLILAGPTVKEGMLRGRDASYVHAIEEKIISLGLADRVKLFTEFVASADYIKASDVYLLPGVNEGLGTPMLESIGSGVPVVANKEPAFEEWIEHGVNGYVYPLDPALWADAIQKAVSFSGEQKKAAAEKMLALCGYRYINTQYVSHIRKLIRDLP